MAKINKTKLGGVIAKADVVVEPSEGAPIDEKDVVVEKNDSPERRALIAKLDYYNVQITGSETDAELAVLLDSAEIEQKPEVSEQEEIEGVYNQLSPKSVQMTFNGKTVRVPLFFVAKSGGKSALYNENGKRISPAYGPEDRVDPNDDSSQLGTRAIAKAEAQFNVFARQKAEQEAKAIKSK